MSNNIRLVFAGDFCSIAPAKIEVSKELSLIFENSDLNILNLEGTLNSNELCTANKVLLKQSEQSIEWCKNNRFSLVSLANNHSFDFGQSGLVRTMNVLKEKGVDYVGAGCWEEAYRIKIIEIKGKKIGFYAATSRDLAALKDRMYDGDKVGCAWINHPDTRRTILKYRRECDFLFILPHAGVEYMDIPLPEWRDVYKELLDLGADGIFASHPHVPQGVEDYEGKPIFYSLGNFFFEGSGDIDAPKPQYWNTGQLAVVDITEVGIQCSTIITKREKYKLGIESSPVFKEHIKNINELLNNREKYDQALQENVLRFYGKYKSWLLLGLNAYEAKFSVRNLIRIIKGFLCRKPNERSAMHQLREESTAWIIQRAFKIRTNTQL